MTHFVSVPKERVGVIVGQDGRTKRRIEKISSTKLEISHEGEAKIEGNDSLREMKAADMVKAIGRGFSPERTEVLIGDDYVLDVIEIGGNPNQKMRTKARIIGTKGKTRKFIEEMLECEMSVYGDTVSIICSSEKVGLAREAIEMLMAGSNHGTVYKFVEKAAQNLNFRTKDI